MNAALPDLAALDTNGIYALGIPAYLLLVLLELAWTRARGLRVYGLADTLSNLSGGLGEVLLGLYLGPHLVALYQWAYTHFALVRWPAGPAGTLASWIVAFLAADLGYYVYHRCGHRVRLLWCIHGVHHQSDRFNLTIAMRHPWLSDFYSAPFYAALPLLGIPSTQFFVAISLISFYALFVHTQLPSRPSRLGLVAPCTHIVHHSRNPRYVGRNLGAMFTWWDRLFGTHVTVHPDDPPELGVAGGVRTYDGARAQWIFFAEMLHLLRQARTARDRLRVVFGRPGWVPPGATPLPIHRPSGALPPATRVHLVGQFATMTTWSFWILWFRHAYSSTVQGVSVGCVLFGLAAVGGLLDARPTAWRGEAVRLGLFLALGAWLLGAGEPAGAGILAATLFGCVTAGLAARGDGGAVVGV